jgi:hypothetical protein
MDALVQLSGLGDLPPKAQAKKWASFEKRWNFQLKRLYQGSDFSHLAPALLEAAESALRGPDSDSLSDAILQPDESDCPEIG